MSQTIGKCSYVILMEFDSILDLDFYTMYHRVNVHMYIKHSTTCLIVSIIIKFDWYFSIHIRVESILLRIKAKW